MAPEPQIIYLSPEEDLANLSERLAQTQAQRIILVVPSQTQLRSHVSWRLLYSRLKMLGKDFLVISPDRQIRSVARAAGFRIADSPLVTRFRRGPRLEKRPQIEPTGTSSPEGTSPTPRVADLQPPRSFPTVLVLLAILVAVSQIVVNVLKAIEFWSRRKEARGKSKP